MLMKERGPTFHIETGTVSFGETLKKLKNHADEETPGKEEVALEEDGGGGHKGG